MDPKQIAVIEDTATLSWLAQTLNAAINNGQSVSITVDGGLKVKRGESMWTPPLGHTLASEQTERCSNCPD